MTETMMRDLSEQYGVEFAQVYTAGPGKNGDGGYYTLYSGTSTGFSVPADGDTYLINHTHPGGTVNPSQEDVDYLKKVQENGSKIKSSTILPKGKPAQKFNKNSTTQNALNKQKE